MRFSDIVAQAREFLQHKGRSSYRALKLEFDLSDEQLDALKEELIEAERVAVDEGGKVLVWTGDLAQQETEQRGNEAGKERALTSANVRPVSYTPPHLAERIRAAQTAMEVRGVTDGERKTITALFADLKDSTALIEDLDPEEARRLIDPALQLMMDAVHRYEGYVAQSRGDGIFALFGAPIANEDHPQRAIFAALRMQEEVQRYAAILREHDHPPLLMRVGLNTGEVIVRSIRKDDLHADYDPVGHSINLAARMEQLAAPGSILVTEQTHKLTEGYFEFKALGKTQIKGVKEPLNVYEVVGAGPLRTRLQVAIHRGLTRFVGRHSEVDQMQRALAQVKEGHGQIVGVMGEPGLGKSRLFHEFKLTSQSGYLVLEAYSVSYGKAAPYLPLIELLKNYFQISPQDEERIRREKITGRVLTLDRSLEDTLPYLFSLLSIEDPHSSLQRMDAQIRRRRTFEALKKLFLRESLNQPLILIFEDLHWIDSETQGFLDTLSESIASAKVLLLVNYRPEYRHDWGQKTYYTQLRLAPLGKEEAEKLLTSLLGDGSSPWPSPQRGEEIPPRPATEQERVREMQNDLHALKQLVLEKTEGTPFFMEEVVQVLIEEGVLVGEREHYRVEQQTPALHIPATVQGILAARIDRLAAEEKELLQQLAVIGREFQLRLVRHVVSQPEDVLYRSLSSLQRKEFLYEQPPFPEVEYIFKHALTQEVAYSTVLQERRKALHGQTAQAIEALYNASLDEHYSELAHHYSCSGNVEKAIEYLYRAGQQAVRQSANEEALRHLNAALELLQTLPDTAARMRHELSLRLALGVALQATKGYASPEMEQTYTRARELCQQLGEAPELFPVLFGLGVFYLTRAELKTAHTLGRQLLTLAQRQEDAVLLIEAHYMLGTTLFHLGEFASSRAHCEQGLALYAPQQHHSLAYVYGQDPGVLYLSYTSGALWLLGYPDQALRRNHEAMALASKLSHPYSLAFAFSFAASVHVVRREAQAVQERAEAAIVLAREQGFSYFLAWGLMFRGWALAEQGQPVEGLAQMSQGLTTHRATGAELSRSLFLALLAEVLGKRGQVEDGLRALTEALETSKKTGDRFTEAELYRLKGELILQKFQVSNSTLYVASPQPLTLNPQAEAEAEACFQQAIEVAQQQHAKSLELRAVTSLARLWQQRGKKAEAHKLLSEIYHWFTEGFDTKDLQEAKALLDELEEGR